MCPPPPGHPLAEILRPLYLTIVNLQLAIDIKATQWENDLQHLLFNYDQTNDNATKQVLWAKYKQVHMVNKYINIFDGLDEEIGDKENEEEDLYEGSYLTDDNAQLRANRARPSIRASSNSPSIVTPTATEEEFNLPFPSRIVTNVYSENFKEDFDPPFPSRISNNVTTNLPTWNK